MSARMDKNIALIERQWHEGVQQLQTDWEALLDTTDDRIIAGNRFLVRPTRRDQPNSQRYRRMPNSETAFLRYMRSCEEELTSICGADIGNGSKQLPCSARNLDAADWIRDSK